ncbi:hypothetical protein CBR_g32099 [Chara braunii]|uniref:Uncharacterized protein n=1 Tax=Chara braunii TaxID=69332 RepID=A0A388LGU7_CHABU|nr:hypothetical protein CBR_g32099 [Chara braunii]|eukprot:GBG81422.1 hypothetical protein CBR_g32099 [Chara braunii]
MEDRSTGFLTEHIINEAGLLDEKQRMETMNELHEVGKIAETAYLENQRARSSPGSQRDSACSTPKSLSPSKSEGATRQINRSLKRKSEDSTNEPAKTETDKGRQKTVGLANALSADMDSDAQASNTQVDAATGSSGSVPTEMEEDQSQQSDGEEDKQQTDTGRGSKRTRSEGNSNETDTEAQEDDEDSTEQGDTDMEDEEDQDQDTDPDSLEYVQQYVCSLELNRSVELEVRLAHHKHLRNLRSATKREEDITTENKYEILKREEEINEFYAAQYSMKARVKKNKIEVDRSTYEQHFNWPKSYAEQKAERKLKKQRNAAESGDQGKEDHRPQPSPADPDSAEDLRRQAAILEAQVNTLRDQNRKLNENCLTLKDVAGVGHKEIEAAARLDARSSPKRRTILPYRWNTRYETWEVAYHRSHALISVPEKDINWAVLCDLISDSVPDKIHTLGTREEGREEWKDQEGDRQVADMRPLLMELEESAYLKGDLCWVPWQAIESMPYGLLGGEMVAERATLSSAQVTAHKVFTSDPNDLQLKLLTDIFTRRYITASGS